MSKFRLSDQDTIDDINPFVQRDFSLPGVSRRPYPFQKFETPDEGEFKTDDERVICDYGITAGDRTVDMCKPNKSLGCDDIGRPLLPGRNIDMGVDTASVRKGKENTVQKVKNGIRKLDTVIIIGVVAIILLLSSIKR